MGLRRCWIPSIPSLQAGVLHWIFAFVHKHTLFAPAIQPFRRGPACIHSRTLLGKELCSESELLEARCYCEFIIDAAQLVIESVHTGDNDQREGTVKLWLFSAPAVRPDVFSARKS